MLFHGVAFVSCWREAREGVGYLGRGVLCVVLCCVFEVGLLLTMVLQTWNFTKSSNY